MSEQLELFPQEEMQPQGSIEIPKPQTIQDSEWCFQFFNNEPVVFGWQSENTEPSPLVLQLQPVEGDVLTFRQNGMEFKIFARPISEDTKQIRKEQDANQNQKVTSESSNS
jgi:hypothetical protein